MEKYLLDSDTLIHYFKSKFRLEERIQKAGIENCFVSEITIAELIYGAEYSTRKEKHLREVDMTIERFVILPISNALKIYGKERARLRNAGTPVGSNDIFIAATAIKHDLIMVSGNTKDMGRIENLQLEDWTKPEHNEFLPKP